MTDDTIANLLEELRTFDPPEAFRRDAVVASPDVYDEAERDFEAFWAKQAEDHVTWFKKWDTVLEWDAPFAKWFVGGKLNIAYNCLDRHVEAGFGDKVAYHWEGEPGDTKTITYGWLLDETCRVANRSEERRVGKECRCRWRT